MQLVDAFIVHLHLQRAQGGTRSEEVDLLKAPPAIHGHENLEFRPVNSQESQPIRGWCELTEPSQHKRDCNCRLGCQALCWSPAYY